MSAKLLCLIDEITNATRLIELGFCELQKINGGNACYHLSMQLLASGIERLFKCYICLVYHARNNRYPDSAFLKSMGHDLNTLKEKLLKDYFATPNPAMENDKFFLENDSQLNKIITTLSEFGKYDRYYNLTFITDGTNSESPEDKWHKLEYEILNPLSIPLQDLQADEYLERVNKEIIIKIEKLCRAIARQFTLGNHGESLKELSSLTNIFRGLTDDDLGKRNYNNQVV